MANAPAELARLVDDLVDRAARYGAQPGTPGVVAARAALLEAIRAATACPKTASCAQLHPASVRVLEDGRCTDTGGGGGRCLRLANHSSAHRYFDVDAGALWQAVADLMDLEGEHRREAEQVREAHARQSALAARDVREALAARDTALAEAQALRLSLEEERRRGAEFAAAARPVVELAEVGSVTTEDREALRAVRAELARRTT